MSSPRDQINAVREALDVYSRYYHEALAALFELLAARIGESE